MSELQKQRGKAEAAEAISPESKFELNGLSTTSIIQIIDNSIITLTLPNLFSLL